MATEAGLNRFVWDMRYPDAHGIEGGTFFLGGSLRGPEAIPGQYKVKVTVGDQSETQTFRNQDRPAFANHACGVSEAIGSYCWPRATSSPPRTTRSIRFTPWSDRWMRRRSKLRGNASVAASAQELETELNVVLHKLYEPRFTGYDDQTLIYPLAAQQSYRCHAELRWRRLRPDRPGYAGYAQISAELNEQLATLKQTLDVDLPALESQN